MKYDPIVFTEGMVTEKFCPWCKSTHEGEVFMSSIRWVIRFTKGCGRERILGYTMPVDALFDAGLLDQERASMDHHKQLQIDDNKKISNEHERIIKDWHLDELASGRTRKKYI